MNRINRAIAPVLVCFNGTKPAKCEPPLTLSGIGKEHLGHSAKHLRFLGDGFA